MKIYESTTKTVNTNVNSFVVVVTRTEDKYTVEVAPVDKKDCFLTKSQLYEVSDKIKLLAEMASKS